jgi:hypothetical protein
MELTP